MTMTLAPETAAVGAARDLSTAEPLRELYRQLLSYAPTIALFFAVIVAGLIAASILRRLTVWAVEKSGLDALAERAGAAKVLYAIGIKRSVAQTLGMVVWLSTILVTLAAAAELMGLSAVTSAVGVVVSFLPRLVVAAVVMVGGAALASILRGIVRRMSKAQGEVESPAAIASLVYYVIITVSVLVAADQAGIETQLVDGLVTICVAIALAGVSLAFALGSRDAFRSLVAGHYLRRLIDKGDEIEIEGHRGVVVRFSPIAVVLRTERGERIVSTRSILDGTIDIVAGPQPDPTGPPRPSAKTPMPPPG